VYEACCVLFLLSVCTKIFVILHVVFDNKMLAEKKTRSDTSVVCSIVYSAVCIMCCQVYWLTKHLIPQLNDRFCICILYIHTSHHVGTFQLCVLVSILLPVPLHQVVRLVSVNIAKIEVHAFISWHLDYCICLPYGISDILL